MLRALNYGPGFAHGHESIMFVPLRMYFISPFMGSLASQFNHGKI